MAVKSAENSRPRFLMRAFVARARRRKESDVGRIALGATGDFFPTRVPDGIGAPCRRAVDG